MQSRMAAGVIGFFGPRFPLGARRERIKWQLDLFDSADQLAGDWDKPVRENSMNRLGDFLPVLFGQFQAASGSGISVAGAAQRHQGYDAGVFAFEVFLRITGPVTAQLVELTPER